MNKIVFLTIIAMIAGAGSLQAQKKGGKTQPKAQTKVQAKVQPATERKPKTAEIDSLIRCYLFGEAARGDAVMARHGARIDTG